MVRVARTAGVVTFIKLIRAIDLIQTYRAAAEIRLAVLVALQEVAHVRRQWHITRSIALGVRTASTEVLELIGVRIMLWSGHLLVRSWVKI